jgi:hemerythrin-like domain-containing protein
VTDSRRETIIDSLRSDHRAIVELLDSQTIADATELALTEREQLVMSLIRHFVAEEQYLYPTVRDLYETDEIEVADRQLAADRELENRLRSLETPDVTPAVVAEVIVAVRSDFGAHVAAQDELFDELTRRCPPERLSELGADVRGAEQLAPTRPRRFAPRDETTNKIVSYVEGYLDHIRDHYSHRGSERDNDD